MNLKETNPRPKKKSIFARMGWFQSLFLLFFGVFMLIGGNEGYRAHKVYLSKTMVDLAELSASQMKGDVIKITGLRVDCKNRVRALYSKKPGAELSIFIPLRAANETQDSPIKYLYLLPDYKRSYARDSVQKAYNRYNKEYVDMLEIEELVAVVYSPEDFGGNIPDAIRRDERVSKDVIVLERQKDDPAWGVFVFFGSVFLILFSLLYFKHWRRAKREEENFI